MQASAAEQAHEGGPLDVPLLVRLQRMTYADVCIRMLTYAYADVHEGGPLDVPLLVRETCQAYAIDVC